MVNVNSGKDLDVTGASRANSAQIIQWTDTGGTNQQWNICAGSLIKHAGRSQRDATDLLPRLLGYDVFSRMLVGMAPPA
ncbi:MAG: RICIN domain-containing protein [Ktedonobacteraceae bacterium]|nr:RICIN domain-containing protein [Ktedonobacteraceae bacterium]